MRYGHSRLVVLKLWCRSSNEERLIRLIDRFLKAKGGRLISEPPVSLAHFLLAPPHFQGHTGLHNHNMQRGIVDL